MTATRSSWNSSVRAIALCYYLNLELKKWSNRDDAEFTPRLHALCAPGLIIASANIFFIRLTNILGVRWLCAQRNTPARRAGAVGILTRGWVDQRCFVAWHAMQSLTGTSMVPVTSSFVTSPSIKKSQLRLVLGPTPWDPSGPCRTCTYC